MNSHVLVFPFPIQGHINPMFQFSKRLVSKGLKVTLITTATISKSIQGQASSIGVEPIFDGYQEGEKAASPDEHVERYNATAPQGLSEIINKYSGTEYPVNCVIYDSILPWALDVARKCGIQGGSFFTQSCSVCAVYYHVLQGTLQACLQESVVTLPSIPPLKFKDLPSFSYDANSYPAIYDLVYGQFSNIQDADWLFWNTFSGLEEEIHLKGLTVCKTDRHLNERI